MTIHTMKARNQPSKKMDLDPQQVVLDTLRTVSQVVGVTLGPGGRSVLLERQEQGLPPFLTKDGVTVYRNLGFDDPIQDLVMEVMRDTAVRTANEAGDGTSTSTIFGAALVDKTMEFCRSNRQVAPQMVMRSLMDLIQDRGIPFLQERAVSASLTMPDGKPDEAGCRILRAVAKISANGDSALADVVVPAMRIAGDYGNVILTEAEGPSLYKVEKVAGYTLPVGWEDTMRSLWQNWITDSANQRCVVERPRVLCFNGRLNQFSTIAPILQRVGQELDAFTEGDTVRLLALAVAEGMLPFPVCAGGHKTPKCGKSHLTYNSDDGTWACGDARLTNVLAVLTPAYHVALQKYLGGVNLNLVVVASAFSDEVLTQFFVNFREPGKLKLVPVVAPHGPSVGYQAQVLQDVAAIAGARVLDPVSVAGGKFQLADLGPGVASFEMSRTRSNLVGCGHEFAYDAEHTKRLQGLLGGRVSDVSRQAQAATSTMDRGLVQERLAKLTGGLACITVQGGSNGEIRERRDRAEDAVCAVRGAIKAGCLPGGCWGLLAMGTHLLRCVEGSSFEVYVRQILLPALHEPLRRLLGNAGMMGGDVDTMVTAYLEKVQASDSMSGAPDEINPKGDQVYDLETRSWVDPFEAGLLDSAPAVVEAVRSAASIALQLGTCGAIVAYRRDTEVERREAASALAYSRATNDEANERG